MLILSVVSAGNIYTENPDTYLVKLKVLQAGEHMLPMSGKYKNDLPLHFLHSKEKPPSLFPDWSTVHILYLSPTLMYSLGIDRYLAVDSMINTGFTEIFSTRIRVLQSKQP